MATTTTSISTLTTTNGNKTTTTATAAPNTPSGINEKTPTEHNLAPASFPDKVLDPEIPEIDHIAEKKLVRKLDLFIVPPVMLLYLFVSGDLLSTLSSSSSSGISFESRWTANSTAFSELPRPGQHWKCTSLRDGRRPAFDRGPISNSRELAIRHIHSLRVSVFAAQFVSVSYRPPRSLAQPLLISLEFPQTSSSRNSAPRAGSRSSPSLGASSRPSPASRNPTLD